MGWERGRFIGKKMPHGSIALFKSRCGKRSAIMWPFWGVAKLEARRSDLIDNRSSTVRGSAPESRANRKSTVAIRPLHSLRISGLARAWSTSVAAAREAIFSTGNSATALFICSVGLLRFSAMFERERDLVAPRSGIMLCRFLHSHNDVAMPQSGLATDSFPQGNAP